MRKAVPALLLLMGAPLLAQSVAPTAAWWRDYAERAHQIPIGGGRSLNLLCEGSGAPTILLESGTGDGMSVWRKVQPALAQHFHVCAYDRAGLGLSPASGQVRDLDAIVGDLEKLLASAGLHPPYLLVSHSFGGLIVRLYARRHPEDVAGLVLVDPPSERQIARIAKILPGFEDVMKQMVAQPRACASAQQLTGDCAPGVPDDAPPAMAARFLSLARVHYTAQADEEESAISGRNDAEIEAAGTDLGDMPLIVLTSEQFKSNGAPATREASQQLWMTMHDEIAAHSKRGTNRIVPGTGHYIQFERPDAVIAAVEEVASASRAQPRTLR